MANETQGFGFGRIANAISGGYSLIRGLTRRKPKPYTPTTYNANVRPAQANTEGLQRTKNEIADQVSSATRDVTRIAGSDANSGILARLGVQQNANKAVAGAEAQSAEMYRADQNRVSEQLDRQGIVNAQILNEAKQIDSQNEQAAYTADKAAATSGVQSAINYEVAREADLTNKRAAEKSANQVVDAYDKAAWGDAYNKAIEMGKTPAEATAYADELSKRLNYAGIKTNLYTPRSGGLFGRRK